MKKSNLLLFFLFLLLPVGVFSQGFVVVLSSDANRNALTEKYEEAMRDGLNPEILDFKLKSGIVYRICTGFFDDVNSAVNLWDDLRQKEKYKDVWVLPVPPALMTKMPEIDKDEFSRIYANIALMINTKDYQGLNRYINPAYGFYVMINPGSSFLPVHLDSIPTNLEDIFATGIFIYFDDQIKLQPDDMTFGEIPAYNCETGDWSKEGCFIQGVRSYSRISRWEYSLLEYDDWDDASVQKLRLAESKIVLRTINTQGFEIDFAYENGKWYIAAFDLATDCNQ
ncbi:MAG: hypothetical protein LCH52_12940 [Bacteroidetes bacterium]|nr:hypothetical protein [Bacteroidota bacterium]